MPARRVRDWPYLMKPETARAYLDDMPAARFKALVTPFLDRRTVAGELFFTRRSIDDWIDQGGRPGQADTPEDLMRMLDDDSDEASERGPAARQ